MATTLTVKQAVRNAVDSEYAAARFYRALVALDLEPKVREFFDDMAQQEEVHARSIEEAGKRLVGEELPEHADMNVSEVEAAPEWLVVESIDAHQALAMARENEYRASLFYDALADYCPEPEARFFRDLAQCEIEHARRLEQMEL
jgi:rubrerythrin